MAISTAVARGLKRVSPFFFQKRFELTVSNFTQDEMMILLQPPATSWSDLIRDAEKVVGYPTSFMNMRCLLSDEFADLAQFLRNIDGSNNLVMETTKNIIYGNSKNLQPWGLTILLLSMSFNNSKTALTKQTEEQIKILVEVTEMIRTGHFIHNGIINIPPEERSDNNESALLMNKIAILLGDYLLATASVMLRGIKNFDVSYIMSSGFKDLAEGQFIGERDEQNMPLPGKPIVTEDDLKITFDTASIIADKVIGKALNEWTARSMFNGVSLLGKGCQSAMILSKQSIDTQKDAYNFGCHVGLAWQAGTELQALTSDTKDQFCLASAPVLFALKNNPDIYKIIEQGKKDVLDVNYEDLKFNILKTDAVDKTKLLYKDHAAKATAYLNSLEENAAVNMLKKLINIF